MTFIPIKAPNKAAGGTNAQCGGGLPLPSAPLKPRAMMGEG